MFIFIWNFKFCNFDLVLLLSILKFCIFFIFFSFGFIKGDNLNDLFLDSGNFLLFDWKFGIERYVVFDIIFVEE